MLTIPCIPEVNKLFTFSPHLNGNIAVIQIWPILKLKMYIIDLEPTFNISSTKLSSVTTLVGIKVACLSKSEWAGGECEVHS